MLYLYRRSRLVRRARRNLLGGRRPRPHAVCPAVEANPVDGCVIEYRLRIGVVNVLDIHVAHRGVVIKSLTLPMPTSVTLPEIAKAVRDAAIESDRLAPVTVVPNISFVAPCPIPRRPEQPGFRWLHPGAGYPEVAVLIVVPITWGPDPTLFNENRLFIHRQFGRCERNGHRDLRHRVLGEGDHRQTQRQRREDEK